jgi:predicted anti-sigma-YlaC factor YlaD
VTRHCPDPGLLQDHLEGLLPGDEAVRVTAHLRSCDSCRAEADAFRAVFASLEDLPLEDVPPRLESRILDAVLPSRRRRRWVRTAGWAYAGSLAACVAAGAAVSAAPAWRGALEGLLDTLSRGAVQALVLAFDGLGMMMLGFANGWGFLALVGDRLAPLTRALASLVTHPTIESALVAATAACVGVLWWLHGRDKPSTGRMDHVGLVGF